MVYKKLIYTAISRARNKLVLIGDKDLFLASAKLLLVMMQSYFGNNSTLLLIIQNI